MRLWGCDFWRKNPIETIRIQSAQKSELEEICDYLKEKSIRRPLYHEITPELLENRLNTWPHFTLFDFLIARNSQNKIVGCMAPWNNGEVQNGW